MRLFVASFVKLDDYTSIRRDFEEVLHAKWVREENLHLTWAFLGEQLSALPWLESLQRLTPLLQTRPLHSLGSFARPPRILFARVDETSLLRKSAQLRSVGFPIERFKPHVTLCRIKRIHDLKRFNELKKKYEGKRLGWIEREISLVESVLTPDGPNYLKLQSVTEETPYHLREP